MDEPSVTTVALLTDDLILCILCKLDVKAIVRCATACKQWRSLRDSDKLWERLYERHYAAPEASYYSVSSSNMMGGCAVRMAPEAGKLPPQEQQPEQPAEPADVAAASPQPGGSSKWKTAFRARRDVEQRWQQGRFRSRSQLPGHEDYIRCVQLCGEVLVSASGSTMQEDCSARVWDLAGGRCSKVLKGHEGPIWAMVYCPDATCSTTGGTGSGAAATAAPEPAGPAAAEEPGSSAAEGADNNGDTTGSISGRVATASADRTVRYWDAATGNCLLLQDLATSARCITMDTWHSSSSSSSTRASSASSSSDTLAWPEFLAAGTDGGHVYIWATSELERQLGSAPATGVVRVTAATAGQQLKVYDYAQPVTSIQVQGDLLVCASEELYSHVPMYRLQQDGGTPRLLGNLSDAGLKAVQSLSFDRGLGRAVAGCGDKLVRVWDLDSARCIGRLEGHSEEVQAHQFDAARLASASLDGKILIWDMRQVSAGRSDAARSSGAAGSSSSSASGSSGSKGGKGRKVKPVHVLEHECPLHAFQMDDARLVSGEWDGTVNLWDLRMGRRLTRWQEGGVRHEERVWAVVMDKYRVVTAGLDHKLQVLHF